MHTEEPMHVAGRPHGSTGDGRWAGTSFRCSSSQGTECKPGCLRCIPHLLLQGQGPAPDPCGAAAYTVQKKQ